MPVYNENDTISFWEMVSLISCLIQIASYFLVLGQASNDDILKEIQDDMEQLRQQNQDIQQLLQALLSRDTD